jgi:hypothetical protein
MKFERFYRTKLFNIDQFRDQSSSVHIGSAAQVVEQVANSEQNDPHGLQDVNASWMAC